MHRTSESQNFCGEQRDDGRATCPVAIYSTCPVAIYYKYETIELADLRSSVIVVSA